MPGIDHVDLVVSSLERSLPFYRGLLEPLGYTQASDVEGERGERIVYIQRPGAKASIGLREAQAGGAFDRYAVGIHHLAVIAESREMVDDRAAWLREQGAKIESGPGEYEYTPGYYALFFYDPDGIKLEIVYR